MILAVTRRAVAGGLIAIWIAALGNATALAKSSGHAGGHGNTSTSARSGSAGAARNVLPSNASGSGHGPVYGGSHYRTPPPLDTSRRVVEQDCSKPITQPSGNLKCK